MIFPRIRLAPKGNKDHGLRHVDLAFVIKREPAPAIPPGSSERRYCRGDICQSRGDHHEASVLIDGDMLHAVINWKRPPLGLFMTVSHDQ